jgi:hypothetical protein
MLMHIYRNMLSNEKKKLVCMNKSIHYNKLDSDLKSDNALLIFSLERERERWREKRGKRKLKIKKFSE